MLSVEARFGVDGVSMWKTGMRANPFPVFTSVDLATRAAALDLYRLYEQQVGQDSVTITWANDVTSSLRYVVLAVRLISIDQLVKAVGGLNGGAVLLRCEWLLQPVEV